MRFDTVEKIFHRTSGFAQANHDTSTIGVDLANARGWEGYRLELRSEADIPGLVERLMEVFHTDAEPYYAKYSDLEAVDRSLNDRPRERTVHSMIPWMRCAKGIVIANLLERTDYEELVSIYRETLRHDAKGFYLPWFEALVKDLEMLNRATHRRHD